MTRTAGQRRDRTHWLYVAVILAVLAGVAVGLIAPGVGTDLSILGTIFVNLIKMMIAPVIFCTVVLGIGSVAKAVTVGRIGGDHHREARAGGCTVLGFIVIERLG